MSESVDISDVEMDAFELRSMADCTVGTFSTVLVETIKHALIERDAAIAALEARVTALEAGDSTRQTSHLRTTAIDHAPHTVPAGTTSDAGLSGRAGSEAAESRITALEARLMVVESRPVTKDAGVWRSGVVYSAGDITTFRNSGWICHNTHLSDGSQPSHDHFRLFVRGAR